MARQGRDRPVLRPGTGRLLAGLVLTTCGGVPLLFLLARMILAAAGPDDADPHGYLMIFGVVASLALAIPVVVGLGLFVAGARVRRGFGGPGRGSGG